MVLALFGGYSLAAMPTSYGAPNGNSSTTKQQHRTPQDLLVQGNNQRKWTGVEIAMVIFMVIYLVFWVLMITSAFTSTSRRSSTEQIFSVFEALILPEVWLFQHGIGASQVNTAFFSPMPALPK